MRRLLDAIFSLVPIAMVAYPAYRWHQQNWHIPITLEESGFIVLFSLGLIGLYLKFLVK